MSTPLQNLNNANNIFHCQQGSFLLNRLPQRANELLRAWDSADEYLLEQFANTIINNDAKVLIVNDSFGALAIALHHYKPYVLSDSYLSQQATRLNLAANQLTIDNVHLLNSLATLENSFDLVLIKVPKTLALLEDELIRLRPHIHNNTQILVAGMQKTLPSTLWALLERLIGKTQTFLAKKKAKLIQVIPDLNLKISKSPYPIYYQLENSDYLIANHANVFSRDSLDIGTRFFLQYLPTCESAQDIIDLGCGNGILGLCAAKLNSRATVHFIDESFMAIESAKENFYRAFENTRLAQFYHTDGLIEFKAHSADLILCNPPFHQQQIIGDYLALSFFKQAKCVLRLNGQLWVIGNRHLNYPIALKRLFGHCQLIASNQKFVIIKVIKK